MIQANFNEQGLLPAIIQDKSTQKVLMLGWMNEEALVQTIQTKKVTFFSRSRNKLWVKGETSGNYLMLHKLDVDCDRDTLLVQVRPLGPVCHTGSDTCWGDQNEVGLSFISDLEEIITQRKSQRSEASYISGLFEKGINKIAQKVGEEAVEMIIEAKDRNDDLFLEESADLFFHYLLLLQAKDYRLQDVIQVLQKRNG